MKYSKGWSANSPIDPVFMTHFEHCLSQLIPAIFSTTFGSNLPSLVLHFQTTRKEFPGDITLVTFNIAKEVKHSPEETGRLLGEALVKEGSLVAAYNVVKGFLNIEIHNNLLLNTLESLPKVIDENSPDREIKADAAPFLVEYSSPNTNKPLHLGHLRNILLGFSVARILAYSGKRVLKVNIVNDRGIHICKSMIAWKKFGNGETPDSTGMKGDHLVGKYYVAFDSHYRQQMAELKLKGISEEEAARQAPILLEAQEMLRLWEAGDVETVELWKRMNGWVYDGFEVTYQGLGVDFDKIYYESETYLLGKKMIEEGVSKGILYRKADGSVWADLRDEGLDEKLLLRSDGTSVYMTQDIGTAVMRFEEFGFDKLIYVVGNEQDYHFKVLFHVLKKLGYNWSDRLFHLSYNMVDLPSGKMKSREGTVVDADELISEMQQEARKLTIELGKITDHNSPEALELYHTVGMGALKYYLLKVDPEKRMLFNPNESIDFNGNTGPFIQYTYARIRSVLRKAQTLSQLSNYEGFAVAGYASINPKERELVKMLLRFPDVAAEAAQRLSPAVVANYVYDLAKSYNQFYHEHPILDTELPEVSQFRLRVSSLSADIIAISMKLLGIAVPERM